MGLWENMALFIHHDSFSYIRMLLNMKNINIEPHFWFLGFQVYQVVFQSLKKTANLLPWTQHYSPAKALENRRLAGGSSGSSS